MTWPYPRIVAHRGGGTLAPENTLAAIETAARRGVKMVEFDVKLAADSVPFLLHDDEVDRTSNGHGAAAAMNYETLAALDAGSWFDARFKDEWMPALDEVAGHCRELKLAANVEIKPCPGRDRETGRLVALETQRLRWALSDGGASAGHPPPLLSSFSHEALQAARNAAPALPRGLLFKSVPPDWRAQCASLDCVSLHADHRKVTQQLVREIRAAGLYLLVYTVNEPDRALELAHWGVDAICTDRIDLIGGDFLD